MGRKKTSTTRLKVTTACSNCQKRKIKCSGETPCGYCVKISKQCLPGKPGKKRGPPPGTEVNKNRKKFINTSFSQLTNFYHHQHRHVINYSPGNNRNFNDVITTTENNDDDNNLNSNKTDIYVHNHHQAPNKNTDNDNYFTNITKDINKSFQSSLNEDNYSNCEQFPRCQSITSKSNSEKITTIDVNNNNYPHLVKPTPVYPRSDINTVVVNNNLNDSILKEEKQQQQSNKIDKDSEILKQLGSLSTTNKKSSVLEPDNHNYSNRLSRISVMSLLNVPIIENNSISERSPPSPY